MLVYLAWRIAMRGASPLLEVDVGATSGFAARSSERREGGYTCHELKRGLDERAGPLAEVVAAVELWALLQLACPAGACAVAWGALWTTYTCTGPSSALFLGLRAHLAQRLDVYARWTASERAIARAACNAFTIAGRAELGEGQLAEVLGQFWQMLCNHEFLVLRDVPPTRAVLVQGLSPEERELVTRHEFRKCWWCRALFEPNHTCAAGQERHVLAAAAPEAKAAASGNRKAREPRAPRDPSTSKRKPRR